MKSGRFGGANREKKKKRGGKTKIEMGWFATTDFYIQAGHNIGEKEAKHGKKEQKGKGLGWTWVNTGKDTQKIRGDQPGIKQSGERKKNGGRKMKGARSTGTVVHITPSYSWGM